jgi:hypothetical protein
MRSYNRYIEPHSVGPARGYVTRDLTTNCYMQTKGDPTRYLARTCYTQTEGDLTRDIATTVTCRHKELYNRIYSLKLPHTYIMRRNNIY